MRSGDVFPSKYLKAEELDEDVQVTISKVVLEELEQKDGKKQEKPVCYFEEGPKGLILNKTNWALIAKQHGDESDDWTGKKITLTTVDVDAFGDVVSAIRVKPPKKQSGGSAFPKAASPEPPNGKKVDTSTATLEPGRHITRETEYWAAVKKAGLGIQAGKDILKELSGNFDEAYRVVVDQHMGNDPAKELPLGGATGTGDVPF
jgi:hypothetical protein